MHSSLSVVSTEEEELEDLPAMANFRAPLLVVVGLVLLVAKERTMAADFDFNRDMSCYWGPQNLAMSSTGDKHDEIDFEFLGNVSGQPYIIHTNIYTQGVGNREVQFYPWFDPTSAFHNYTIHWNPSQVVWFIDGIPIRVFRNYQKYGIAFPNQQGMRAYSSIWNGDSWATRGGLVKIDWKNSPFTARYQQVNLRACPYWRGSTAQCSASSPANWWTSPAYSKLSYAQQGQLMWVRSKYMIYDYCQDKKRFNGKTAPECSLPLY
ncbi:hypothetical protein B296_00000893 [Ensete ventricosum]|uniref:Xyloglucan endotransglucosylase/hydrolase n=1 Tax=Ensete ventricosum TaxID=4639 RepID=A0A427B9H4_ENSVE|nr:hypothetical protein B296_00000893 [Ensete ventricosum]